MAKERDTILIVDDAEMNREILKNMFEDKYHILEAGDGNEALRLIEQEVDRLLIILLDILMPGKNGFEVLEEVQEQHLMKQIPVMLITGDDSAEFEKRGYQMGVADIVHKPFNAHVVIRRVENIIDLYQHKNRLEDMVEEQTRELEQQAKILDETSSQMIDTLGTVVEFRSMESGMHIKRIKTFTQIMIRQVYSMFPEFNLSLEKCKKIVSASAMHDVGKIAIPDRILLKPGRLEREEFEIMKLHTVRGCKILENLSFLEDQEYYSYCYEICRSHHERYDGKGYPDALKGDEIPVAAQAVAVADVYDALVTERVYKKAFSKEEAYRMIRNGECGTFSDKMMICFERAKPYFEALATQYSNSSDTAWI